MRSLLRRPGAPFPWSYTMSLHHKLETIATLLDGVRWHRDRLHLRARCPVHGSRGDSLSVRIHPASNRLQVTCFAGCGSNAVLDALGLEPSALYPERPRKDHRLRRVPPPPYREALIGIDHEAHIIVIAAARLEAGHALTRDDLDRLVLAVTRINAARRVASTGR
jgi:hypothetical protein